MYSPVLGRFLSADTIVPQTNDPQSLNRFSYVRNDPLGRVDPSGSRDLDCISYQEACDLPVKMRQRILQAKFEVTVADELGLDAINEVYYGVTAYAWKLAQYSGESAAQTFTDVFDPITIGYGDWDYCGAPSNTRFECSSGTNVTDRTAVHEMAHMFSKRHTGNRLSDNLETVEAIVAGNGTQVAGQECHGGVCSYKRTTLGYVDAMYPGLQHGAEWLDFEHGSPTSSASSEDFADMMLNWIYADNYDNTGYGPVRSPAFDPMMVDTKGYGVLRNQWFDSLMISEGIWHP